MPPKFEMLRYFPRMSHRLFENDDSDALKFCGLTARGSKDFTMCPESDTSPEGSGVCTKCTNPLYFELPPAGSGICKLKTVCDAKYQYESSSSSSSGGNRVCSNITKYEVKRKLVINGQGVGEEPWCVQGGSEKLRCQVLATTFTLDRR